ncbi:hypothetical protein AJ79_09830 [Helicocarpus griseus UAMH5409]|uniref:AT hook domain-containing protein n=1 Tax=Helicocarpus griseus UAMH5409 TaxID=1447875 RepID=A0A2B7WH79_9EURO|nr:hypothetical protein AJ79_09830 [Helicocarpus griseus UAMH5409]
MSSPADKSWSDEEKTYLLTEIIKRAGIPPAYLFNMILDHQINPAFEEIPLPTGRSLNACKDAYGQMAQEYRHLPSHRQSLSGPTAPLQMSPGDRKRPLPALQLERPLPGHRAIQPKPIPGGGYSSAQTRTPQHLSPTADSHMYNEPPRKRGRPSKVEIQRRNMVAQARGETYPPMNLARPGIHPAPSAPTPTTVETPTLPAIRPQIMGSPVYGSQVQHTDALGSQTQDIQVHRAPRAQSSANTGVHAGLTPNSGPGESTPRTIVETQAPPAPTSLPPSFRGINQSSSVTSSPRPETPRVSSTTTVENGGDITPAFAGPRGGNTS